MKAETNKWLPGFAPGKHVVWCADWDGEVGQGAIIQEDSSHTAELKQLEDNEESQYSLPWYSEYGYQVTGDGWVLGSGGERLLWLPHNWRPKDKIQSKWSGRYLGLWNKDLLQPVILKLEA